MNILAIDPSGNFEEGKGKTGICLFLRDGTTTFLTIDAKKFKSRFEYWKDVTVSMKACVEVAEEEGQPIEALVIEDYILYNNKKISASSQTNSKLETPRLIGIIEFVWKIMYPDIPIVFQKAMIKTRFNDDILIEMGLFVRVGKRYKFLGEVVTNDHERDALRHALYYNQYGKKKEGKGK